MKLFNTTFKRTEQLKRIEQLEKQIERLKEIRRYDQLIEQGRAIRFGGNCLVDQTVIEVAYQSRCHDEVFSISLDDKFLFSVTRDDLKRLSDFLRERAKVS